MRDGAYVMCVMRDASMRRMSCVMRSTAYVMRRMQCVMRRMLCVMLRASCVSCVMRRDASYVMRDA
jgi:hypothetical protein